MKYEQPKREFGKNPNGETTRIIDAAIQELFTKWFIVVKDHHDTKQMHERVFVMILRRLNTEHAHIMPALQYNRRTLEIRLF